MSIGFYETTGAPPAGDEAALDAAERLASMSREEVDELPYGFVILDEAGTILLYNRYESSLSRLPPGEVVGKNFFKEVAPCTRVDAFYGRFRAFLASLDRTDEAFRFRFHFEHGTQDVSVQFVKAPPESLAPPAAASAASRVFMTVERTVITEALGNPEAP